MSFVKYLQYRKFCLYGFLKNLQFFDPYLIIFFRDTGLSFLQIGILFSVRELGTNILEIPSGVAADVFGRRRSMIVSFIAYIVSFLLFFFFSHFVVFLAAMVAFSLGEAFRTGTHKAMILDYLKMKGWTKWKVFYYGHTRSWSQIGSAVSAVLAALLVFYSGSLRSVFLFTVIPYLAGLVLFITYPKELDGIKASQRDLTEKFNIFGPWKEAFLELGALMVRSRSRRAFLSSSLFDGFFKALKDYIQPMIEGMALSLPVLLAMSGEERVALIIGAVYFILYVGTSQVSKMAGSTAEKIGSLPRAMNGTYLVGILFIFLIGLFYHLGYPAVSVGMFIIYYFLENLRRPVALGYVTESIKDEVMATGLSGESQIKTLFVAVLAPAIGLVADLTGLGLALAAVAVVAALMYPVLRIREED
jgi:MFS family permease